jgi:hypothetical protein
MKSGFNHGHQRYKCKDCGYHYSKATRDRYPKEVRECALKMVADGMGFRQVERALGVSNVTVMQWVRKYGNSLLQQARERVGGEYDIVELDELCTFIGKKNGDSGCGFVLIECQDASCPSGLGIALRQP